MLLAVDGELQGKPIFSQRRIAVVYTPPRSRASPASAAGPAPPPALRPPPPSRCGPLSCGRHTKKYIKSGTKLAGSRKCQHCSTVQLLSVLSFELHGLGQPTAPLPRQKNPFPLLSLPLACTTKWQKHLSQFLYVLHAAHLYTTPLTMGGPSGAPLLGLSATTSWGPNLWGGSSTGEPPKPLLATSTSRVRPSRPPSVSEHL